MKITLVKVSEVKFSAITKVPSKTIITMAAIHQHPLYYCSKRLFSFEPFAQTEFLHNEVDKGIHHFFSLTYTEDTFEECVESINNTDGTQVPIVSLENNAFWMEVLELVLNNGQ